MAKTKKLATLYRPDTMNRFTKTLMQEPLTEPAFQQDLESAGRDFSLEDLLETVHQTLKGKQVVETLLYRKSLRDLCITSDDSVNVLRTQDAQYTSSLVNSGLSLPT